MNELLRNHTIYDEEALIEYLNLISTPDDVGYIERHHILPRALFPQYAKDDWNIVTLSYDNHIKAHELLYRMYQYPCMRNAWLLMSSKSEDERKQIIDSIKKSMVGDNNPAKRDESRRKISESKKSKPRPDIKGKKYFGADEETINQIKVKNSINKKNKVVVKDLEGNNLQVDVNDPRYLNGELIPINKGRVHDLDFSERNIKISEKRQERMRAYSVMSFDEMVEHIIKSFHDGKKIFTPSHRFERNYVTMIKQTNHDIELILQTVVQRLSKDSKS